jgi:hypothetical protein
MATGDTYIDLGIKMKLSTGTPTAMDQAGLGALTWVDVAGVVTLPQRGDTSEDVSEPTLADGRIEHAPGILDGGVREIPIKHVEADAGQLALLAAAGTNATLILQEVDPDGDAHFYYGRVMSMQRRESTGSTFKGYILTFGVNSDTFIGTEES